MYIFVHNEVTVPRSFGSGGTPHPYFTPSTEKEWGKSGITVISGRLPARHITRIGQFLQ